MLGDVRSRTHTSDLGLRFAPMQPLRLVSLAVLRAVLDTERSRLGVVFVADLVAYA